MPLSSPITSNRPPPLPCLEPILLLRMPLELTYDKLGLNKCPMPPQLRILAHLMHKLNLAMDTQNDIGYPSDSDGGRVTTIYQKFSDWFFAAAENMGDLEDVPDLSGDVEMLSYQPVFVGPYSIVYRGRLKANNELVTIKVINPIHGAALHTIRRKIERERRTWSALHHPNILLLYGFADDDEHFQPFGAFISPWLGRGDLAQYLRDHGTLAPHEERLKLWKGVVAGVAYLHGHNPVLIHGDLKPRNILINEEGDAVICDFGLVRVYLEEGNSGMTTTTPHTGTERYLAYELFMAEGDVVPTTASDIYAIGCIGLEILFLETPYSNCGNNLRFYMLKEMQTGNPPAVCPQGLPPSLVQLWGLISWCWDRDPLSRPRAYNLSSHLAQVPKGSGTLDTLDTATSIYMITSDSHLPDNHPMPRDRPTNPPLENLPATSLPSRLIPHRTAPNKLPHSSTFVRGGDPTGRPPLSPVSSLSPFPTPMFRKNSRNNNENQRSATAAMPHPDHVASSSSLPLITPPSNGRPSTASPPFATTPTEFHSSPGAGGSSQPVASASNPEPSRFVTNEYPHGNASQQSTEPLSGIIHGFGRPALRDHDLPAATPVLDVITLEPEPFPPYFIVAHTWKHLIKFLATQNIAIIEPSPAALAREKYGAPNLRVLLHFAKMPRGDYRIVLYFAIQSITPPPQDYPTYDTSVPPYLFPSPDPGRPLANVPEAQVYTIPTKPLPALPIKVPNLAPYLTAALDESYRHHDSRSRLAKLVNSVNSAVSTPPSVVQYMMNGITGGSSRPEQEMHGGPVIAVETSSGQKPSFISRIFRPKTVGSKRKGLNDDIYDVVTPFNAEEYR